MLMLEYLRGMGTAPELQPDVWGRSGKKFQISNFDTPNNVSSMKYALQSVPGLADVGFPHGDGEAPGLHPDVWGKSGKKFQTTIFDIPNNVCSIKYAQKSVPGLADVGVLHGDEDGPRAAA